MKLTYATSIILLLFVASSASAQVAAPAVKTQVLTSDPVAKTQGDKKLEKKTAAKKPADKKPDANAQNPDAKKPAKKTPAKPAKVSPERTKQLLDFVGEHHAELKGMLDQLEKKKPKSFRQAINGIHRSVGKIEAVKSRSPQRYEGALEQWKLNSRINVATVQLKLDDKPENRKTLEDLLGQLIDVQVDRFKEDRDQLLKRADELDQRISGIQAGKSQEIQKRVNAAIKRKKPPQPIKAD